MTTAYLLADIQHDEGYRSKAYRDTQGIWTIGVGHNIQTDPNLLPILEQLKMTGLTQEQIIGLLHTDVMNAEAALDRAIPWWRHLEDPRQDVLANMCFNLGVGGLMGFHNTLGFIESGAYEQASQGMLNSLWATQVGKASQPFPGQRAYRLSQQMLTGERPAMPWDPPVASSE